MARFVGQGPFDGLQQPGCRSWVNCVRIMIFGPERDPGKVLYGIGIVGIEFQPLDYHSVVGVQGFEPVQRFLGRSEQLGIAIVLNQIDAEYGKTQRSRTDTEEHNKQNGPDNVFHLAWPTVETSQFSIAEIRINPPEAEQDGFYSSCIIL